MFELTVDAQDEYCSDPSYQDFIHEPISSDTQMVSFYLFNVTNPALIVRGYKPDLTEVGPFSYTRWETMSNTTDTTTTTHDPLYASSLY